MTAPLPWRLVDEYTGGPPNRDIATCVDIDGLFIDPPTPPPLERYILRDCAPNGSLRAALDGTGPAWLGNIVLDAVHPADRPRGEECEPVSVGCSACMEELLDVTVVGHRPSTVHPDCWTSTSTSTAG